MNNNEIIEKIFNFKNADYDNKHKLNLLSKPVSVELLDIVNNGITLEYLETINYPVCIYHTQITIHGIYPDINYIHCGGYKNIIQNKNKSIGVKYSAIDSTKKIDILNYIRNSKTYYTDRNSTHTLIYKCSEYCNTIPELNEKRIEYKSIYEKIDKSLFYGAVQCNVYKDVYGRGYFIALEIYLNAIYEKNINQFVFNITGMTKSEIDKIIEQEKIEQDIKDKAWEEQHIKEQEQNKKKYSEVFNELSKTYEVINNPVEGIYIKPVINYDGTLQYIKREYKKRGSQILRRTCNQYDNIEQAIKHTFASYDKFKICNFKSTRNVNYFKV